MISWFQAFAFKCNLYRRYATVKRDALHRELALEALHGQREAGAGRGFSRVIALALNESFGFFFLSAGVRWMRAKGRSRQKGAKRARPCRRPAKSETREGSLRPEGSMTRSFRCPGQRTEILVSTLLKRELLCFLPARRAFRFTL
jgi:hypothetical protein